MFLTQIYGTILGGFVNYAVMVSIVNNNRDLLTDSNGTSSWSGATIKSYNTNAASWALAKYMYQTGTKYELVPFGLAFGAGLVALHRAIVYVGAPCCSLPSLLPLTLSALSFSPSFEASRSWRSICPSSSNTPAISPTTRPRLASS